MGRPRRLPGAIELPWARQRRLRAQRPSVVLGVVGAGGIGVELTTSMQLLRYDEALTIILAIFVVVLGVERLAAWIRGRVGVGGEVAF